MIPALVEQRLVRLKILAVEEEAREMATLSAAGAWLQQSILGLCSNVNSAIIQLDADAVASLVSYCERAPPSDAKEYLSNMIGEENCKDIIAGYLQRRGMQGTLNDEGGFEDGMHVYVKPQASEIWSAGSKKIIKNFKPRVLESITSSSFPEALNGSELSGPSSSKGKSGGGKAKRTGKGISLAEAAEGKMIMSRGAPCTCLATRHKLVNNCLSCGRIVCEQEGEGPCNFCGALVLSEGSTYAGLEGSNVPMSDSEAAAQAFKDRLVEYGRTSSQRTTVIDDQSDYFQVDESTWLSEEEKQAIIKRQEEAQLAEEARKKKVVVSIDLLGRKVVMASDTENDVHTNARILEGIPLIEKSNHLRIKPNPYILKNPVFVSLQEHKETGIEGKSPHLDRRPSDMHRNDAYLKTGRVQHDDPFVYALRSYNSKKVCENPSNDTWKTPKLKERVCPYTNEDEECLMDCEVKEAGAPVFDICEPQKGKRHFLSPPLLAAKQAERSQKIGDISDILILRPGMILLKHWLSQNDQVEIVQICRDLGIGSGGFYRPGYGTESKMHLHMMCLGLHWEPLTRSYEKKRSIDDASPPMIPSMFETRVAQSLRDARHAVKNSSDESALDMVPEMHPNICLINFYEHNGRLGLHQDRDENKKSLMNGTPVVSFSIGDSAEFLYGVERDVDTAKRVVLESGDVLIFGGPSRMIFHGVPSILPQTAPSWLIEKTNLRPGRMNLTFRQT